MRNDHPADAELIGVTMQTGDEASFGPSAENDIAGVAVIGGQLQVEGRAAGSATVRYQIQVAGGSHTAEATVAIDVKPLGRLRISPQPIDFGPQSVATTQQRAITVTNESDRGVEVDLSGSDDVFEASTERCGLIEPGGECEIDVSFTPPEVGNYELDLVFTGELIEPATLVASGAGLGHRSASGPRRSNSGRPGSDRPRGFGLSRSPIPARWPYTRS